MIYFDHKLVPYQVLSKLRQNVHNGEHLFVVDGIELLWILVFQAFEGYRVFVLHQHNSYPLT